MSSEGTVMVRPTGLVDAYGHPVNVEPIPIAPPLDVYEERWRKIADEVAKTAPRFRVSL